MGKASQKGWNFAWVLKGTQDSNTYKWGKVSRGPASAVAGVDPPVQREERVVQCGCSVVEQTGTRKLNWGQTRRVLKSPEGARTMVEIRYKQSEITP